MEKGTDPVNGALVVILALVWAMVLLPGAVRSRRSSPTNSVGTFERAMDVLARRDGNPRSDRNDGRYVYVPHDAGRIVGERTRRRNALIVQRRRMFVRLLAAAGVTLPLAILFDGILWVLFLASVAALAAYVGLLLRWKAQADQAAEVVRNLPDVPRARDVASAEQHRAAVGAERAYGGLQVATRDDDPWEPQSGVRIRRWDD